MGWTGWPKVSKEILAKIIHTNSSLIWNDEIYTLSLTKITKTKHAIFFLESTNLFTIYSYETSLNVLFRFSLKICFWKGSFLIDLFNQWTTFFYLLWDQIWYLSGSVSKHHFKFSKLFFSLKVSSQIVESPPNYGHDCTESIPKY